jgi:hypothetical protein
MASTVMMIRMTQNIYARDNFLMRIPNGSRIVLILTAILLLSGVTIFFVQGCARIPLSYMPGSISKASGSVSVSTFKYLPAETGKIKPFQIRNTALGNLKFDKNIDIFFRDAIVAELGFSGVKTGDKTRVLGGEIEDFLIDELSTRADWTLKVHYLIINPQTGNIVFSSTKTTKRKASKLVNVSSALNEMIKLNIEELLKDEAFVQAIH